jgi:hypothetical protein
MDKIGYHAVIKFFVEESLMPKEIHYKFIKVYGGSSPSFSTIKKWAAEVKCGLSCLEDDPREGRRKSALVLREIMLKNKHNFEIIHSFFLLLGRELFRPPSEYICE